MWFHYCIIVGLSRSVMGWQYSFPEIVTQVLVFAVCFLDRTTLDDLVDYRPSLSEETIGARGC
eukprot:scaffold687_cov288-Chaetoceros_neogracile.AAC.35